MEIHGLWWQEYRKHNLFFRFQQELVIFCKPGEMFGVTWASGRCGRGDDPSNLCSSRPLPAQPEQFQGWGTPSFSGRVDEIEQFIPLCVVFFTLLSVLWRLSTVGKNLLLLLSMFLYLISSLIPVLAVCYWAWTRRCLGTLGLSPVACPGNWIKSCCKKYMGIRIGEGWRRK